MKAEELQHYIGKPMFDNTSAKIGSVKDVYLDESNEAPAWITVSSGIFGTKQHFVPVSGLSVNEDGLMAAYPKDIIVSAPHIEDDAELAADEEDELYRHYARDTQTATVGHDTSGPTTDDAMTRSEEEMHVSTERHETGRVRLRKYIVTENVQVQVPVSHEEVRLEREPITDANRGAALDGPALSEEEHEVVLHAERPVVTTEVVAKERVRIATDTVTDNQTVDGTVKKEVIEQAD